MSTRTTHERLIRRFRRDQIRAAILELLRADGLSILSDEAAEALARDLATHERMRSRLNQENRATPSQLSNHDKAAA